MRLREIELQRTPREMALALPFHRRAPLPFLESTARVIIQVVPPKSIAKVRSNLTKAGPRYSDPLLWILMKWLGAALLGGGVYGIGGLRGWSLVVQAVVAIGCAGFAYQWPEWSIRRAIQRRQAQIIQELPETLDLLTISVEAGLGLDQVLETVSRRGPVR